MSTRRDFLRGGVTVAGAGVIAVLTGCEDTGATPPDTTPAMDAFLVATVALGDMYDLAMAVVPPLTSSLTPLRDAHRTHAQTLADAMGKSVPKAERNPGSIPVDREAMIAKLRTGEQAGRDSAIETAVIASARLAPLIGSIAACRATHLEVLV